MVAAHRADLGPRRLTEPIVLKHGNLFLLCTDAGDVSVDTDQGLYFHDMRHLSEATLLLNGHRPRVLLADASDGQRALHQLSDPLTPYLGLRREHVLDDAYTETFTLESYTDQVLKCTLQLRYSADFADMFVVRGAAPGKRGRLHDPDWRGRTLRFRYDGADKHVRKTTLRFDPAPDQRAGPDLTYEVQLKPRQTWRLVVTCELREQQASASPATPDASAGPTDAQRRRAMAGQLHDQTQVKTSNPLFDAVIGRCFMDLHMLRMREREQTFFAAGVPWYVALFGRDSLVTALEVLAFEPDIAANTLRVLAAHQATCVADDRDAQPGKIPHELRMDEMANLGEIPQAAYYGSVDSTPLFLVLLGAHATWAGTLDLFHELHGNVLAALEWIDVYGDTDGDGFIDYQTRAPRGSRNQGWKDSADGIVMHDGRLAEPPIALPEVQGEVYLAWLSMADLFERDGDAHRAALLRERAAALYRRFNREFWLKGARYYAFCRDRDGQFSRSIASNAAHTLWTGIVDPRCAPDVVKRVQQPDMFSGWGVRTLSAADRSFNPLAYQLGSVWPHDNAMIVAGMYGCGFADAANQVFAAMVQAAVEFDHFRLPELFAGFDRGLAHKPVRYPVACTPQAWAAGAIPLMLCSALGLRPDAFSGRLRIVRPRLPDWLEWVTLQRVRLGDAEIDLRFERSGDATVAFATDNPRRLAVDVEH